MKKKVTYLLAIFLFSAGFATNTAAQTAGCPTAVTNNAVTPTSNEICDGETVSFTGSIPDITLDADTSLQWQDSTTSGLWVNIPNANGLNYTTGTLLETTSFRRLVVIAGGCDTVYSSNEITVTVNPTPSAPTDGVPSEICFGDANTSISATVGTDETIDWYETASGGTALLSGNTSYTSSDSTVGVYTYYAEARNTTTDCVSSSRLAVTYTIKDNPTLSLTSATCSADLSTYTIVFASNGTVTSSAGTVSNDTITGITAGTDVTLTATLNSCTTVLDVTAPDCNCPTIPVPTAANGNETCFGDANTSISATVGTDETIDWYETASGGTALLSGNTSYTSSDSTVGVYTYYAEARNTTTDCVSSSRLAVTYTIKDNPTLSLTSATCSADLSTYTIVFASNGTVTSSAGTVSNDTITGITAGTDVTLTATLNSCTTVLDVTAPDCNCPTIPVPTAANGNETCFGDANTSISATVGTGETIDWYETASGGTALLSGNTSYTSSDSTVGVYTYYAEARNTTTDCVSSSRLAVTYTIKDNPTLSLTSATCSADLSTYTIVFASNGTVTSSAETVSNDTVTGITAGTDVTLTATLNSCTTVLDVTAPDCNCPTIPVPTAANGNETCFGDANTSISATVGTGETIDWYETASGGTALLSGNTSYTSSDSTVGVYTYYAEARNTTTDCVSSSRLAVTYTIKDNPTLSLTSATCSADLSTYTIVFASNGTVTSSAGTVSNDTVTGITAGTDVTLTATLNSCTTVLDVTAPDCNCPTIPVPTAANGNETCFGDANTSISATVGTGETIDWYETASGGTALLSGNTSYTSSDSTVGVYTYYAEARNTTTDCVSSSRLAVTYTIKDNPTLSLTSATCSADLSTYTIVFASNGTVTSSAGTVSNDTVTGITAGTDVTLTATLNSCTTVLDVTAPDCNCPTIPVPTAANGNETCFGDANTSISATVGTGETIDWYETASGGTALLSGNTSYTSSDSTVGVYTYYAEARNTTTDCVSSSRLAVTYTIKDNPTLSLTSATCAADLQTYDIVFVSNGTVTSTAGTVNNTDKTITGITAGTNVTLTATLNSCTTELLVTAPDCSCPTVATPTNGVPSQICFGDNNAAISAIVLSGETIDWYSDATGGTLSSEGSLSYTSSETAVGTYTYYAEARNTTTNCVSSSRLEVTYTIKANPTLSLTSATCAADLQTYDIVFVSNGTVTSTAGTVNNTDKTITGINAGTDVTLTATLNSCTTVLDVTAPDCNCPTIPVPTAANGNETCFGDANTSISATVGTGETIDWYETASGGTALLSGNTSYTSSDSTVGVYTYYAEARNTTTDCVSSSRLAVTYTIKDNPTLSLTSATCAADLQTYDIVFVSNGTVTSTAGTVNNTDKTITGITAGTNVTLTATLNSCTTELLVTAPDCSCPTVATPTNGVPSQICFGDNNAAISAIVLSGETIDWYSDATGGTLSSEGSLSYTSSETAVGTYTYYAEARNTTTNCVSSSRLEVTYTIKANPTLSLTSATCAADLQTYDIVFVSNGTVTSTAGTVNNTDKTITGINAGTDVTLTATLDGCITELPVTAPDCNCPAVAPPSDGVSSEICFGDNNTAISASVSSGETIYWYAAASGGTALFSGNTSYTSSETAVGVYTYYAEARNTTTNCVSSARLPVTYTIKANPTLSLTSATCTPDLQTYDIVFVSNGTVTSTAGIVDNNTKTVTGITAGTDVTLTATLNGCTTDLEVTAPDCSCPTVAAPTNDISNETCFGDANTSISATVGTGETIDWYAAASGGTALLSGNTSYTSSETAVGVYTYYAEARNTTSNCVSSARLAVSFEIKVNPTLNLTSATCSADLLTYTIVFISDGTVTSTSGTVNNTDKTVTGIPSGTDVTLTATLNGCTTDLGVTAPNCSCPAVAAPTDGIPSEICFGDANTSISATVGTGETIDWYAAASGGTALLSGNTSYTSTATAVGTYTYYAQTRNTTSNCVSSARLAVSYTIKANPTLSVTSATCTTDLLTYDIVFASNGTVTSTAGTVNNNTKTVTGITAGTDVTLTATLNSCTTDLGVTAPNCSCPAVAAPTDGVPSEICFGDASTSISASVSSGETIDWYAAASGGTALVSGNTSYTSTATAVGVYTYYAEARNTTTNCVSSSRLAVTFEVISKPVIANVTENNPTVCQGQGSLEFIFTGVPNGVYTITYDGNSFNNVTVSDGAATVLATARKYNNLRITVNGCTSENIVNASLSDPNPPPTPTISVENFCGESVLTASNFTGSLTWDTGETTESITVFNAREYTLTQTINGCTSDAATAIAAPDKSSLMPDVDVTDNCGESQITVNNLTDNAWLFWQFNNEKDSIQGESFTVYEEGEYTIYQKLGNCSSLDAIVSVNPLAMPSPPIGNDKEICATEPIESLTAEATTPDSNTDVLWFDDATGGNEILSPVLDTVGSVTYYAESLNNTTGCTSKNRTPVTLTIKPNPKTAFIDTTIIGKPQANVAVLIFPNDSQKYQWYLNNDEIINATKQYYYINESERVMGNTFTIEVELQNGCKARFDYHYSGNSFENEFNAFKSSKLTDADKLFTVYPNPVSNNLNISVKSYDLFKNQKLNAKIYSVTGACVLEIPLDKNPKSIDTKQLRPGFYSISITSNGNRLFTKKLIVTKH